MPGNRPEGVPVQSSGPLAILTVAIGAGKLMASRTHKAVNKIGNGGVQEWLAEEPITGVEFRCVLGQKTLNEKALTVLATTGPLGYEDVKPYYDKLDELVGVFGTNEGLAK